ncbi:hypothetical protein BDR07DRAFT_120736 [Suillus spraguei]|nr:hypothetical protein BDR07DRAFT_120736 [Suillus spraguei]
MPSLVFISLSMDEDNSPRKKRWPGIQGLLNQSRSDPHLSRETGGRGQSLIHPLTRLRGMNFAADYRVSQHEPTVASSSDISSIKTTQHHSPLVASTLKPNPAQSSNSGIAKAELPPDMTFVTEMLTHAQTGVAGISPIDRVVQNTASATGNLRSVPVDKSSSILGTLKTFHAVADQIVNLHPYAKVAFGILTQASKMILDQANFDIAVSDLLFKVSDVYVLVTEKEALAHVSSMIKIYTKIAQQTLKCAEFVVHYSETKSFWKQLGKQVFRGTDAEIRSYSGILDGLMQRFRAQVVRDAATIPAGLAEGRDPSDMEYAAGAGLDPFKCCLPDTRDELLTEIKSWIGSTGEDVPRVLWLSGMAGKGKSAIAHTIANWSNELGGLGACFCFDRTRRADRRHEKIFTTIARDLADRNPIIRKALAHALHDHSELKHTADIASQWQRLL